LIEQRESGKQRHAFPEYKMQRRAPAPERGNLTRSVSRLARAGSTGGSAVARFE